MLLVVTLLLFLSFLIRLIPWSTLSRWGQKLCDTFCSFARSILHGHGREQRHIGGIQWLSEQKLFGFRWAILSTAYRIGTGLVWFGLRESGSTTLGKDCASSFARGRRTSNFVRRTNRVSRHWLGSSQENGSVCRYARQSFRLETAALLLLLFPLFCHSFPFFSSLVSHFSLSLSAFPTTLRPHATLRVMHFGTFLIPDLVHCSLEILLY